MFGCAELDDPRPRRLSAPEFIDVSLECTGSGWLLEAETSSWTRGGMLWLDDGLRRERHSVPSVAAEVDQSGDFLRLTLDVIADSDQWQAGRTSGFLCGERPLRQVYAISFDYEAADCRRDPGFPEIEGVDPCGERWP
ncbi:MAG: hypothetical protein KC912_19285 [Proteobacteria bacterium]|nr:hypothetical protein [Pseudomonadota bacterium]